MSEDLASGILNASRRALARAAAPAENNPAAAGGEADPYTILEA